MPVAPSNKTTQPRAFALLHPATAVTTTVCPPIVTVLHICEVPEIPVWCLLGNTKRVTVIIWGCSLRILLILIIGSSHFLKDDQLNGITEKIGWYSRSDNSQSYGTCVTLYASIYIVQTNNSYILVNLAIHQQPTCLPNAYKSNIQLIFVIDVEPLQRQKAHQHMIGNVLCLESCDKHYHQ